MLDLALAAVLYATPAEPVICPDGTYAISVDAAGTLGCPGPAADPGHFPYPPGTVPIDEAPAADPADPCFRQDEECTVPLPADPVENDVAVPGAAAPTQPGPATAATTDEGDQAVGGQPAAPAPRATEDQPAPVLAFGFLRGWLHALLAALGL